MRRLDLKDPERQDFMALSEAPRPTTQEPSPAPTPPNGEREVITPKTGWPFVIETLKREKFMGVPKIVALPVLLLWGTSVAGVIIYQDIPPVHRALDNAYHSTLETLGLENTGTK